MDPGSAFYDHFRGGETTNDDHDNDDAEKPKKNTKTMQNDPQMIRKCSEMIRMAKQQVAFKFS